MAASLSDRFDTAEQRTGYAVRFRDAAAWRARQLFYGSPIPLEPITFLIPHYNCATFLDVCLHAIRRHHPASAIIVSDGGSAQEHYALARTLCRRYDAELRTHIFHHGHTGQLNRLLRYVRSGVGVFLDQDCVLLDSLNPLIAALGNGPLLIGPRDEMYLTQSSVTKKYPEVGDRRMRLAPDYIHASLMIVAPQRIREEFGSQPFTWKREWNREGDRTPLEPYYGLCERIRRRYPEGLLPLASAHSNYGLGMAYLWEGKPIAHHQWYSGRIHKHHGKMDEKVDVDWLQATMSRFIADYWSKSLNLGLQLQSRK